MDRTQQLARWGSARVVVFLLVALLSVRAVAQAPTPLEQREASARKLFALGKYNEALEIYGSLYAEALHPAYLRDIGRCYQNLGEPDKSISAFQEYLRQAKNLPPDQRAFVLGYIREMEDLKRQREAQDERATGAATTRATPATVTKTSPPPPPVFAGLSEEASAGPLAKSALVSGMNAVRPKIHDCYNQFTVPGVAMVNVVIGKSGKVISATVTGRFVGTPTGGCVEKAVKSASFPPSDGFTTPYPFNLR